METKEMKIQVPEGYEIDKENSTFECIKFRPIKRKLTYDDVARELFQDNQGYYINRGGEIFMARFNISDYFDSNDCTSHKQAEKLIAINKLMNVAKYFNERSNPNESGASYQFIIKNGILDEHFTDTKIVNFGSVYFNRLEDMIKAKEILGEKTIKTALSTDW